MTSPAEGRRLLHNVKRTLLQWLSCRQGCEIRCPTHAVVEWQEEELLKAEKDVCRLVVALLCSMYARKPVIASQEDSVYTY